MSNLYALFKKLLPEAPLLVGSVVSTEVGGCTISLPTGGTIFARGEASVGDRVFVRDSVIEGIAPSLTVEIINV